MCVWVSLDSVKKTLAANNYFYRRTSEDAIPPNPKLPKLSLKKKKSLGQYFKKSSFSLSVDSLRKRLEGDDLG